MCLVSVKEQTYYNSYHYVNTYKIIFLALNYNYDRMLRFVLWFFPKTICFIYLEYTYSICVPMYLQRLRLLIAYRTSEQGKNGVTAVICLQLCKNVI